MTEMYVIVQAETITELVNDVNNQMNTNDGVPTGGVVVDANGNYVQAVTIKIKQQGDEVLPDQVFLRDIQTVSVHTVPNDFNAHRKIKFLYKDKRGYVVVDNFNIDDEIEVRQRVKVSIEDGTATFI